MTRTLKFYNGDMVRNQYGNGFVYLSGKDKVKQDISITLATSKRKNGLGCGLEDFVGKDYSDPSKSYNKSPLSFEFESAVTAGLNKLKYFQRRYQFNQRTRDELIRDFSPLQSWIVGNDPRNFGWKIDIHTLDFKSSFFVAGTTR